MPRSAFFSRIFASEKMQSKFTSVDVLQQRLETCTREVPDGISALQEY